MFLFVGTVCTRFGLYCGCSRNGPPKRRRYQVDNPSITYALIGKTRLGFWNEGETCLTAWTTVAVRLRNRDHTVRQSHFKKMLETLL
jgi:hypothetical protein